MNVITEFFKKMTGWYLPRITVSDIVEIIIIAILLYYVMVWIKDTRAWMLLKGILVLVAFTLFAVLFQLKTILWIEGSIFNVGIIAIVIIFQPELRRALEQLGQQQIFAKFIPFDDNKDKGERFSDRTVNELIKASTELAKARTGALIVIEQNIVLSEYEKTGIAIDGIVTSQLLINIFEHNTPLHDGAVIIRENRVVAATCYLPLSDNLNLSKELGTRHRAGVGISEVSDSLTIIVSEETGKISIAIGGELFRNVDSDSLRNKLIYVQKKSIDVKSFKLWKGRLRNERKNAK
ncbi:MAG: diadenylate cyclase CdaA [Thermoflexaceae bacterium]|nr:diadenylate cyclase CdaA [Thermoflexaceae bacterium]